MAGTPVLALRVLPTPCVRLHRCLVRRRCRLLAGARGPRARWAMPGRCAALPGWHRVIRRLIRPGRLASELSQTGDREPIIRRVGALLGRLAVAARRDRRE